MAFDFKERLKQRMFRRDMLESILVCTMNRNHRFLPTQKEFILSELVNGTIAYCGGSAGKRKYGAYIGDSHRYEKDMDGYIKDEFSLHGRDKLALRVSVCILKLCEAYRVDPGYGDSPYFYTELYDHFGPNFDRGICQNIISPTFSLTYDVVEHAQKEFLPSLSYMERTDIEGIAAAMRPFIAEDIAFMKKRWM